MIPTSFASRPWTMLILIACGATPAVATDIQLTLVDGSQDRPQATSGAVVSVDGTAISATTGLSGSVTLTSVSEGLHVLEIDAPAGFADLRLPVSVPATGTVDLGTVALPRLNPSTQITVPLSSGTVTATTDVESTLVTGARVQVPVSTQVTGAAGTSVDLAIVPVDRSLNPAAFPGGFEPARLYAFDQAGLAFAPPLTMRLPNDEALDPGAQARVYALLPHEGGWAQVGTATVDAGGTYLGSDTAFVSTATYYALQSAEPAVTTTYRLTVQDHAGLPLTTASVRVNGSDVAHIGTGVYEGEDVVSPSAPVRALVSADLGGGLVLHAFTDPVLPTE
ncbi:hypothetical protein OAX78_02840, partial [Planctomycetota bacterium]|nr:hypothetical protein [Planctomycetota bacterium]